MNWLTDTPHDAQPFLPPGAQWGGAAAPPESTGDAWLSLGHRGPAWQFASAPASEAYPHRTHIIIKDAETSQFSALNEALKQGLSLPDGLVAIALAGQGFRGQRSRRWQALRGNLHLTAYYRIDRPVAELQAGLTMAPAVATVQAIQTLAPSLRPAIKWVNDVLLQGQKVSGVLTATQIHERTVRHAVFGIGLNVDAVPDLPATAFVPAATCLAAHEPALNGKLPQVLQTLIDKLDKTVSLLKQGSIGSLFEAYRKGADFLGREVVLWPEDTDTCQEGVVPLAQGRVQALNPDLSLTLEGHDRPLTSGRMAYR